MKKIFFLLTVFIGFLSCNEENSNELSDTQNEMYNSKSLKKEVSQNPYEYVGVEHNKALSYMLEIDSENYTDIVKYLSVSMRESKENFIDIRVLKDDYYKAVANGYEFFDSLWYNGYIEEEEKVYLDTLEQILLYSRTNENFIKEIQNLVVQLNTARHLSRMDKQILLSTVALAKHSYLFWNTSRGVEKAKGKRGKFWADVGGFAAGFVGSLVYNNNNGGGSDVNPFASGVAVGGLASSATK